MTQLETLLAEQAALRRVATLVAGDPDAGRLFEAVCTVRFTPERQAPPLVVTAFAGKLTEMALTEAGALRRQAAPRYASVQRGAGVKMNVLAPALTEPLIRRERNITMGNPVVHFEVTGKDGAKLASFFSELFGWQIDLHNPLGYAPVAREDNLGKDGVGIGGGVGQAQPGSDGQVTFYVGVPDVEASLAKADELGGTRRFGPAEVPGIGLTLGQFTDPEGRVIGLIQADA